MCSNPEVLFLSLYYSPRGTGQNSLKYEPCNKHSYATCEFHMSTCFEHRKFLSMLQDLDVGHTDVPCHSVFCD
jgi:hypothetical protein